MTPANAYPHGQDVTALQHDLGLLNYYENPVDGVYGPATTAAIKDFQRANGLTVNGIAGPSTMAKIKHQLITGDSQMNPGPLVQPTKPCVRLRQRDDDQRTGHERNRRRGGRPLLERRCRRELIDTCPTPGKLTPMARASGSSRRSGRPTGRAMRLLSSPAGGRFGGAEWLLCRSRG